MDPSIIQGFLSHLTADSDIYQAAQDVLEQAIFPAVTTAFIAPASVLVAMHSVYARFLALMTCLEPTKRMGGEKGLLSPSTSSRKSSSTLTQKPVKTECIDKDEQVGYCPSSHYVARRPCKWAKTDFTLEQSPLKRRLISMIAASTFIVCLITFVPVAYYSTIARGHFLATTKRVLTVSKPWRRAVHHRRRLRVLYPTSLRSRMPQTTFSRRID
jgi:hypothetical protein